MYKKKKKRKTNPIRAKAQLGGTFNFNSFFDQLNTIPALTSSLNQTSHLNSAFDAQAGNGANLLGLIFAGLQQPQANPRTDRTLTQSRGFFGFRDGGSPGELSIEINVNKTKRKKRKGKKKSKIEKILSKYETKINKAREELFEARKDLAKDLASQQFNQGTLQNRSLSVLPTDKPKFKRQLGGGIGRPSRFVNAISPIGLGGNEGDMMIPGSALTFSPLIPSNQQVQTQQQRMQLAQMLGVDPEIVSPQQQSPILAQLGAAIGAGQVRAPIQQTQPQINQLAGIPVNPLGLLQESGPVVVPSRDLTFQGIDAPTLVIPIPGINSVLEVPIAETEIVKMGEDNKPKKRKKRRKNGKGRYKSLESFMKAKC